MKKFYFKIVRKAITKNLADMEEEIVGLSYENNLKQLENYKLFDVINDNNNIFNSCINKYNVLSFIQFKKDYENGYDNNDLLKFYNILYHVI
jgi:regulator of replication initiation timing